ncbi:AB hydrolase superfamily protein YfhM [Vitis vinifera]|uniref:AB hydrolase superfamily protein YfhM n=1 Tax=Vitis vinifera TaxID=29760 RepID=A0A438KGC4_VITVI|nr:AB hydrolase superfamily protein YfhM [Vitis vinifera]
MVLMEAPNGCCCSCWHRAIAFDFRGYGLSQHPPEPEKASFGDLVVDVIGVMDCLGINKVLAMPLNSLFPYTFVNDISARATTWAFLVGKDFGAMPAFHVAVVHPERVSGVITLGIPFSLPGVSAIQMHLLPKGFYVQSELQVASDDQEIMDLVNPSTPLPPWFTEDDLKVYSSLYENSGFRTALQVPYRTLAEDCGITDPKITAPGLLIMGEKDYALKLPGLEGYTRSEKVKEFMPNLEIIFMAEGNHFVQEQLPEQVNQLLITFLNKHST